MAVMVPVALRSFTLRNFIEEVETSSKGLDTTTLRSFTLRNFIEERRAARPRHRTPIAKLYASQLH